MCDFKGLQQLQSDLKVKYCTHTCKILFEKYHKLVSIGLHDFRKEII